MLVNASKAAELLRISPRRVRQLLKQGRIEGAYKIGNFWVIPLSNGKPVISEGTRGPKPRWGNRKRRDRDLTIVKINRQAIAQNDKNGTTEPVISVKPSCKNAIYGHEIDILGPCRIFYYPEARKDRGGARVWLETLFGVEIFLKDFIGEGGKQSLGFA